MLKKYIFSTIVIMVAMTSSYGQLDNNLKAELYHNEAVKSFNQGDYDRCLKFLEKTENTLGATKAIFLVLKIKTHYAKGNFIQAKNDLDNYITNYMKTASKDLNEEILALYVSIEEAADNTEKGIEVINEGVDSKHEDVPFAIIDEVPVFPGCEKMNRAEAKACFSKKVSNHVNSNFNSSDASFLGLSSGNKRIFIMFKIDFTGKVIEIEARAPHPKLQVEAERAVKTLPKMVPGKHNGHSVSVRYSLPITFYVE